GLVELFRGTVLRQFPQIHARAFRGFRECLAHLRAHRAELGKHAQRLRALARKHEGNGIGHGVGRFERTRMIKATPPECLYSAVLWERLPSLNTAAAPITR